MNIVPSCLNVDNAIIFFRSFSFIAARPEIIVVRDPAISRIIGTALNDEMNGKNRINKNTPPVTRVDE